jgi:glycosyltransferase involved in cell wall biosynthesis
MKVLLAQFRKPPCETRFYDKIGVAIAAKGNTVLSAGNNIPSITLSENPNIKLLPIFSSRAGEDRSTMKDFLLLWHLILNEKPDVLIYTSPEIGLLLPLLRICTSTRIIFDIQENHQLNIQKQHFKSRKRGWYSILAKILVHFGLKFCHRIWLAERIYETQLPIPANKAATIENKAASFPLIDFNAKNEEPYFCFSGFISRESGVIRAINFVNQIRKIRPEIKLRVCGYCPDKNLRNEIQGVDFVDYEHPESWESASEIHQMVKNSIGVLMPYYETESNAGKTPSKWFDALSLSKPVLIPLHHKFMLHFENSIGYQVDFQHPAQNDFKAILQFVDNWPEKKSDVEDKTACLFDPVPVQMEIVMLLEKPSFS